MAKDVTKIGSTVVSQATSNFLKRVTAHAAVLEQTKIGFGFDATASRDPTWRAAIPMQADLLDMFAKLDEIPPLVRLACFGGGQGGTRAEYKATEWMSDVPALTQWMRGIMCQGGTTQIEKMLEDVVRQAEQGKMAMFVYIGDCIELAGTFSISGGTDRESEIYRHARRLGELNVPVYLFQEGDDRTAHRVFAQVAQLSGGYHAAFKAGAFKEMGDYAKVAVAKATGSRKALAALRDDAALTAGARLMLEYKPK